MSNEINHGSASRAAISYRNGVLTVICGLLLLLCVRELAPAGVSGEAQASEPPRLANAAAQRIQMIEELKELRTITTKLGSIERTMETRLSAIEGRLAEQSAAMRAEQRRGSKGEDE